MKRQKPKPKRSRERRDMLPCPRCGHRQSEVVKTKAVGNAIRRRRACLGCKAEFVTHEQTKVTPVSTLDTGVNFSEHPLGSRAADLDNPVNLKTNGADAHDRRNTQS